MLAVIPKPPFARDLTPEQEIAEFERLKPRLDNLWNALSAREEEPYTSVVIPSLTLDQSELTKLEAAQLLRGAAALPAHPTAQSAGPHGLRDLAAGPPADPGVLLSAARRNPGQPRAGAPDAALRPRRLAAVADGEDPRAAAPDPADPLRHRRTRRAPS